jgi:hypothetical protein
VTVASWVADGLSAHLAALREPFRTTVATQLQAIGKVISDETTSDAAGLVQERSADAKGAYRIASAVDLEATLRKHEPEPAIFGSNAVISTSATRIRAALILRGSTPDSQAPVAVIPQLQNWGQPLPAVLIMDQAGAMGKTGADVDAVSHGQSSMVARVPPTAAAESGRLAASAFVLSADGQTLRCPNGQQSTRQYPHPTTDGVRFRFGSTQCRGCRLWEACRGPEGKPNVVRFVYVRPTTPTFERRRASTRPRQAGTADQPLTGRADDCLAGALPGLSESAAVWADRGALPVADGVRGAQSAAVALATGAPQMNDARMGRRSGVADQCQRPAWCAHPQVASGQDGCFWPRSDAQVAASPAWRPRWAR